MIRRWRAGPRDPKLNLPAPTFIQDIMRHIPSILAVLSLLVSRTFAGPSEDALRVGEEALAKKEYKSALTTWVNAYNERASEDTANDETCAKLLENAALLLSQTGQTKDAVVCYQNLLKLRAKLAGSEDAPVVARVKCVLAAQFANAGGDLEQAEKLVREALASAEKSGDQDVRLLALTNLGGIMLARKDRLAAHEFYAKVVSQFDKKPAAGSAAVAIESSNGMAVIADFFGRTKDRLQHLKRSIEISRKYIGADDPATYLARIEYATAQSTGGLTSDAETSLEAIVGDLKKSAPSAENKIIQQRWAVAVYRLASVKSALGKQDEVLGLVTSALDHTKLGWSDLDSNALPIYLDLARLHITRKDYREGLKCYQKVLDIRRRELGPDHDDTKKTQEILNELIEDIRKAEATADKNG